MGLSFTAAVSRYFGKKPNQTLTEFGNELKALTDKDKVELLPMLEKALGESIDPPAKSAT
jgi:hypothetical protein